MTGAPREPGPASVEEALTRARRHARNALGEALAGVRALLDAGALATAGEPAAANGLLAPLARWLEELQERLDADAAPGEGPLLSALADALDAEIARWEARARDDGDARAVLRAFLGLRELLWEFGVRPRAEAPAPRPQRSRPRVQRVRVEG